MWPFTDCWFYGMNAMGIGLKVPTQIVDHKTECFLKNQHTAGDHPNIFVCDIVNFTKGSFLYCFVVIYYRTWYTIGPGRPIVVVVVVVVCA